MQRPIAQQLDFDAVIKLVAAHAQTRLGRLLLDPADVLPSIEKGLREARLTSEIGALIDDDGRLSLAGVDDGLQWLEPGAALPREAADLLSLLALARRIAAARRRLLAAPAELELLRALGRELPDLAELVGWVAPRLGRDGRIPDDASPELARLRRQIARTRQLLLTELEGIRRTHSDVVSDAPPTLRRDRYCLPVRASARRQLPGLVLDSSGSGATAFVEPFAVVEHNNELADAIARESEEVQRILSEVADAFAAAADELAHGARLLSRLDAAQARALFGRRLNGRIVFPGEGGELVLRGARHPLLDERLRDLRAEVSGAPEQRDPSNRVVPLDFRMPAGVRTLVISGPNAGGKTVVLKTIGLLVLMAYHGIPLPVEEGTTIPRVDHLWCHVGDEQDVAADLSTFSGAMAATAELLRDGSEGSLVIYDELGTGTDPLEGAALGCALLEELTSRSSLTIASTHLAAIALSATTNAAMDNAAMEYDESLQRPTYTLRVGRPGRSRALEIAKAKNVLDCVLDRARELLGGQHLELDRWFRRLERAEAELLTERTDLSRQQQDVRRVRDEMEREMERLQHERQLLPDQLAAERDRLRRRAKEQLDAALQRLDEAISEHRRLGRRQQQRLREQALDLPLPAASGSADADAAEAADVLAPGMRVTVTGLGAEGVLHERRGSRALVSLGGKRVWAPCNEIRPLDPPPAGLATRTVSVDVEDDGAHELHLLGMDREAAREALERFLDHAFAAGRSAVRVVHGHGTGVLRRMVAEICRQHPAVRSFRHPPRQLGGTGATEVELDHGR